MAITNHLAAIRAAAGVSQSALAQELSLDKSTISRWEQSKRQIPDETKVWLAERFNVSVSALMGWDRKAA